MKTLREEDEIRDIEIYLVLSLDGELLDYTQDFLSAESIADDLNEELSEEIGKVVEFYYVDRITIVKEKMLRFLEKLI